MAKKISDLTNQTGAVPTTDLLEVETSGGDSRKTTADLLRTFPLGDGPKIKEGSDACMGVATLVGGTVVVNTTKVTADSRVFLSGQNASGTAGELTVTTRNAGVGFTILSGNGADTRDVAWMIVEPAP